MRCLVTAGPTFEPLDDVRRLTNFSTGRLGCELAASLFDTGHEVLLLLGEQSTWPGPRRASRVEAFTTTADLGERLRQAGSDGMDAVFHAAAVSDFTFGTVWRRDADGGMSQVRGGKIPTREGNLLAELVPTRKLIAELRDWFPRARLVGWKYEVDGGRTQALEAAALQTATCRTDGCVANGPAYGPGFALVRPGGNWRHLPDAPGLCQALADEYLGG